MSTDNNVVSHLLIRLPRQYILVLKQEDHINQNGTVYSMYVYKKHFICLNSVHKGDQVAYRLRLGEMFKNISYRPSGKDRKVIDPGTETANTPNNFLRRSLTTPLSSDQVFRVTAVTDGVRSPPSLHVSILSPIS